MIKSIDSVSFCNNVKRVLIDGQKFNYDRANRNGLSNSALFRAFELYFLKARRVLVVEYIPVRCRKVRTVEMRIDEINLLIGSGARIKKVSVRI